jgi:ribosome-associated heat shock protein Hsp15
MRFDVALHALRLFRSRSQAAAAIEDGRALLNGQPAKPSHAVRVGDWLTVARPRGAARTVELLELPHVSMSREEARRLVREVEPS